MGLNEGDAGHKPVRLPDFETEFAGNFATPHGRKTGVKVAYCCSAKALVSPSKASIGGNSWKLWAAPVVVQGNLTLV